MRLNAEHLHDLVAEVVYYLYGDSARGRSVEGAGDVAIEGGPGFFIDFCF